MSNPIVIGIDPGLKGGLAFTDGDSVNSYKMPVIKNGTKSVLDLPAIVELMETHRPVFAVLELVHAMPRQGVVSTFTFGQGYGAIKGILAAMRIGYEEITPQKWQRAILNGIPVSLGKQRSVAFCSQRFGGSKLSDGQADAVCLSLWGQQRTML